MDKETLSNYGWVVVVLIVLALMISLATPFGSVISSNIKGSTNKLMGVASDSLNNVTKYESFESMGSGEAGGGMVPDAGPTVVEGANQEVVKGEVTTLSFRSSAAIDTFQEVRVDGEVVERENYDVTEGSTVITFKESYLNSLAPGDHTIDIVSTVGVASSVFKLSINAALNPSGVIPEGATYTFFETGEVLSEGSTFPETMNPGDVYTYGNYEYGYESSYCSAGYWMDYSDYGADLSNGWGVRCVNNISDPGAILESINDKPITILSEAFYEMTNLTVAPKIPNTVKDMSGAFNGCANLVVAPVIPESVTSLDSTFAGCSALTTAPKLPAGLTNVRNAFDNCTSLKTYHGSVDGDGDFSNYALPDTLIDMRCTFQLCESMTTAPVVPSNVEYMLGAFCGSGITGSITIHATPELTPEGYYDCLSGTQITEILGDCAVKDDLLATVGPA